MKNNELKKAFVDGKTIQVFFQEAWVDWRPHSHIGNHPTLSAPSWHPDYTYRIKPEPVKVVEKKNPNKDTQFFLDMAKAHVKHNKKGSWYWLFLWVESK